MLLHDAILAGRNSGRLESTALLTEAADEQSNPRARRTGKVTISIGLYRILIRDQAPSYAGNFDTFWKDIAERSDVSVATVYNHFPSLDELVPACGALIMAITNPPSLEDAPRIFGDVQALEERIEHLISKMFSFYERGEPYIEVGPKERQLPAV